MQGEDGWRSVRFGPRQLRGSVDWADAESRFVTGLVVFVLAALLYPWYEYRVQAWLMARDVAAAAKALEREANPEAARLRARVGASARDLRAAPPMAPEPAPVRLMGAMELRGGPLAIVDLRGQSLDAVRPAICRATQAMLGTPLAGRQVRVQRWRRSAPAVSMGFIQC